jgi:hypothetical protein
MSNIDMLWWADAGASSAVVASARRPVARRRMTEPRNGSGQESYKEIGFKAENDWFADELRVRPRFQEA